MTLVYLTAALSIVTLSALLFYLHGIDRPGARLDRETKRRLARNEKHLRTVTPNLRVVRGGKS